MEEKGWLVHRLWGGGDQSSARGRAAYSIGWSGRGCGTHQAGLQRGREVPRPDLLLSQEGQPR